MFVHLVFTGVSMPNEATLLDAGTSQILQPQTFVWNEHGTAITGAEDDATGQVTTLTLAAPTGLDGHFILIVSFFPPFRAHFRLSLLL